MRDKERSENWGKPNGATGWEDGELGLADDKVTEKCSRHPGEVSGWAWEWRHLPRSPGSWQCCKQTRTLEKSLLQSAEVQLSEVTIKVGYDVRFITWWFIRKHFSGDVPGSGKKTNKGLGCHHVPAQPGPNRRPWELNVTGYAEGTRCSSLGGYGSWALPLEMWTSRCIQCCLSVGKLSQVAKKSSLRVAHEQVRGSKSQRHWENIKGHQKAQQRTNVVPTVQRGRQTRSLMIRFKST